MMAPDRRALVPYAVLLFSQKRSICFFTYIHLSLFCSHPLTYMYICGLQMLHVSGKVAVQGTLAYVSQQAWIMNTTVRDNILFGEAYDHDR